MYICKICNKEFEKKQAYAAHVGSHNRGESYKKNRRKNPIKNKDLHECKYCGEKYDSGVALGGHTGSCIKNPTRHIKAEKTKDSFKGKKHSNESKRKMSASMKKAHREGRAWNIGQSRWNNAKSWPEKFFSKFLDNENIKYKNEYSVGLYSIDFALENKIAIEIDGKQHFEDDLVIKRDKKKNKKLKEENWKVLRIKWTVLFNDTKNTLEEVLKFIDDPSSYKEIY